MSLNSKKGTPVVGIDIGSQAIKVVEAKATRTGVQVSALAIAPTPEGMIENGVITDPAGLGAHIKKLLNENGIKARQCVSAVSGQSSVVLRVIEVPKMTRDEMAETMKWEVERQVPFSPTEVVMDFQPLDKPDQAPDAQNMEVLLAVAQQDMIDRHVETLMAAGLKLTAIDVVPLAAGRALIDLADTEAKEHIVAILDIGDVNADMGIFEKGLLAFPSPPMAVAGVNITRAISEDLGEDLNQSERLKKELGKVDLSRIAAGATGMEAAEPAQDEAPDFGATAYGTPTPFDTPAPAAPEEESPAQETPASPFDLSDWTPGPASKQFTDTVDGPVFDLGGEESAFEPVAPTFDLSDENEAPTPAPGAQAEPEDFAGTADAGDLRTRVGDAIAPVLLDLVSQLRLSLDYYRTRYQNQPEAILLSGGTARLPNLDKFLANELGIPVVVADPIGNVTVTSQRYSAQYLSELSPLFTVSIGLAVRDMLS
ncbi:MAG: type IV pilus assembly protein PilM [Armatimonadota bacterium]|nr:type IV pilus assembly protein PilM [Armatimonadota bacterium]